MTHGSLFSGIGGFDIAAEWAGWDNLFHCEWNPFGQRVLKHYWPQSTSYDDITKTDFTIWNGRIDVLTGGFPCQPYSLAGKRKGKEDERHLWPEMLRAIREIQPPYVVGENVFGLINWNGGLVFDEVQADLEAEGYEVWPYVLPACAVNAPHRRDRVWFVAYAKNSGCRGGQGLQRYIREWELLSGELKGGSVGCETSRCNREQFTSNPNNTRNTALRSERSTCNDRTNCNRNL
jgi:DNA (cytosine-5)-methyltransferase 1